MICPECGAEYRDGFLHCADCDVDLIEPTPPPSPDERNRIEMVKVYETSDAALIPVIESLLDDANIEFSTTSENLQDLFGFGRFGGLNLLIGPVKFFVRADDEQEARALLATLER